MCRRFLYIQMEYCEKTLTHLIKEDILKVVFVPLATHNILAATSTLVAISTV